MRLCWFRSWGFRVLFALGLATVCGCSGSGRIQVVSVNLRKIPEREPLVRHWSVARCVYWVESEPITDGATDTAKTKSAKEQLCLAMEFENIPLLGLGTKEHMWASIRLAEMPANQTRDYRLDNQSLRMVGRRGYGHARWASLGGIVTVRRKGDGHLSGRFRIAAKQQKFFIATGWTGNDRTLILGEFRAVEDAEAGRRILERTERDGMERS